MSIVCNSIYNLDRLASLSQNLVHSMRTIGNAYNCIFLHIPLKMIIILGTFRRSMKIGLFFPRFECFFLFIMFNVII